MTRGEAVAAVVDEWAAREITLLIDDAHVERREAPLIAGSVPSRSPQPLELHFILPCLGAVSALHAADAPPHNYLLQNGVITVELTATLDPSAPLDPVTLGESIATLNSKWLEAMATAVDRANQAIASARETLRLAVDAVLGARIERHAAIAQAAVIAHIPLEKRDAPMLMRLEPKRLRLEDVEKAAAVAGQDLALADDIADDLIGLIHAFSSSLERLPNTANKLLVEDEETIRDVLLFLMNTTWKGAATGETFLGGGKTDILLRWRDRDAFIGECKIWKGEVAFASGLTQLLDRYTVWRSTRVAMILFVRNISDITGILDKARAVIRSHERFVGSAGHDAYRMRAQFDAQQIVTLNLIPVVIPAP